MEVHKVCYSKHPPYLELMQELPGSSLVCNEFSNIHHIGFWSDALAADSLSLVAAQCPLEMAGRNGDTAPVGYANHVDPSACASSTWMWHNAHFWRHFYRVRITETSGWRRQRFLAPNAGVFLAVTR